MNSLNHVCHQHLLPGSDPWFQFCLDVIKHGIWSLPLAKANQYSLQQLLQANQSNLAVAMKLNCELPNQCSIQTQSVLDHTKQLVNILAGCKRLREAVANVWI